MEGEAGRDPPPPPGRKGRNDVAKAGREDQNEFPRWANPAASNSQQGQGMIGVGTPH